MYTRKTVLATNEIYHIYNRSTANEQIITNLAQLNQITQTINYYRFPHTLKLSDFRKLNDKAKSIYLYKIEQQNPLVETYAFAFMPNHFHLLVKQLADNGITKFISTIQNSYAKYFNTRYDRHGSLFQNPFQAKWIESDEQFIHVSRYIHLNPVTAYIIAFNKLISYPFTSFAEYGREKQLTWLNTNYLLNMFDSNTQYQKFVEDQVDYQRTLANIKHITFD